MNETALIGAGEVGGLFATGMSALAETAHRMSLDGILPGFAKFRSVQTS